MDASKLSEKHAEALDRAVALFWRKGYHATTMRDVESALGLHPGSIYGTFGNKEALFRMALARYGARIGQARDDVLAAAPSHLAGLAAFVRRVHPSARDDVPLPACMLARTAIEGGFPPGATQDQIEAQLAATEAAFTAAFEAAQAAGEIGASADPTALARWLHVQLAGLAIYAGRPGQAAKTRAMVEDLAARVEGLGHAAALSDPSRQGGPGMVL